VLGKLENNMDKVFITKTLIKNDNQSELDFVLQNEFDFDYDKNSDFVEILTKNFRAYHADGDPIRIDDMIKVLQNLKDSGSTHVQIETHHDHHGYDISGFEIRLSTQEEIDKFNSEMESRNKINKINELQKQIDLIKNS
jgi:hypothetical protein